MIEVDGVTKRYGGKTAVENMTFTVKPGKVTGFLGPNGAGKSTTMRIVLGLDWPSSGVARINRRRFVEHRHPMHEVGALLDAGAVHSGRSAFAHLNCLARSNGIGKARVNSVLEQVGLGGVAGKRIGGFSLGMRQRLGVAVALLGDPAVLLFDEPVNGLDPEGIRWIRELMRSLAGEGRTVLVSSHLMSEMALTADQLLVVGRGRLITETSTAELTEDFRQDVFVRSPQESALAELLRRQSATVLREPGGGLSVVGLAAPVIAKTAATSEIPVHELTPRSASLEEAYLQLTDESVEYRADAGTVRKEGAWR